MVASPGAASGTQIPSAGPLDDVPLPSGHGAGAWTPEPAVSSATCQLLLFSSCTWPCCCGRSQPGSAVHESCWIGVPGILIRGPRSSRGMRRRCHCGLPRRSRPALQMVVLTVPPPRASPLRAQIRANRRLRAL
jgi:hypothetical protein